jgi:cellulose synthase/poly-beta-1,6-N-acetylglucosamine synthase-like glycosyltransferase
VSGQITVLVPAHNEGTPRRRTIRAGGSALAPLREGILGLQAQTNSVDRVIVIADNCTDDTVEIARQNGADVFETRDNTDKKAGALNQWLDEHLSALPPDDLVLVMDADSVLAPDFVANALTYVDQGYDAVGGVFLGKPGGGLIGMYQRNEYARYARDVARKHGRTLVLTGTATIFTVDALQRVVAGRERGVIPDTGAVSHVYDTKALTEDNELTFALLHLGMHIVAPSECRLLTEVMPTWEDLRRQRFRWKRGAIENNRHYGLTRHTLKYHALQWWSGVGIVVTAVYVATLIYLIAVRQVHLATFWLLITGVYVLERVVTVSARGRWQMALAGLLFVEMPYDITLQIVQAKAFFAALFRTKKSW